MAYARESMCMNKTQTINIINNKFYFHIQNNASYFITCKTTGIMKSVMKYKENEREAYVI
jgi:hypothetical protein